MLELNRGLRLEVEEGAQLDATSRSPSRAMVEYRLLGHSSDAPIVLRFDGRPELEPSRQGYLDHDGAMLAPGSWYPRTTSVARSRFTVSLSLPDGWSHAVTAGARAARKGLLAR